MPSASGRPPRGLHLDQRRAAQSEGVVRHAGVTGLGARQRGEDFGFKE